MVTCKGVAQKGDHLYRGCHHGVLEGMTFFATVMLTLLLRILRSSVVALCGINLAYLIFYIFYSGTTLVLISTEPTP